MGANEIERWGIREVVAAQRELIRALLDGATIFYKVYPTPSAIPFSKYRFKDRYEYLLNFKKQYLGE